jgi:hypothetical protein
MYDLAGEHELDLEALRARLQSMSHKELLRFGKSARFTGSPAANLGKEPRQVFVIQLREAEKGWRRRHSDKLTFTETPQVGGERRS